MAKAVVVSVCELAKVPTEWVTPAEGKEAATGKKTASKDEVNAAIREQFNYPHTLTEHEADACAAYLAAKNGSLIRLVESETAAAPMPDKWRSLKD